MGAPNDGYVVAAVLFDNPGIKLPDLVERLNEIGSVGSIYDGENIPFSRSLKGSIFDGRRFHSGILGVSRLLGIKETGGESFDDWAENLHLARLEIVPRRGGDNLWIPPSYRINLPDGSSLGRVRTTAIYSSERLRRGDEISLFNSPHQRRVLKTVDGNIFEEMGEKATWKVLKVSPSELTEEEKERFGNLKGQRMPKKKLVVAREVIPKGKRFEFDTLEELVLAFPEYAPDALFDYSQGSGEIQSYYSSVSGRHYVYDNWVMISGGYYLDIRRMIESGRESDFTSMVLTAEAIKKRNWEVLKYCSGDERPGVVADFLVRNPDSNRRHKDAILYFRSVYDALKRGLTNADWLRERAFLFRPLSDEAAREEYRLVVEEVPALIEQRDKRREYERKSLGASKKSEDVPF